MGGPDWILSIKSLTLKIPGTICETLWHTLLSFLSLILIKRFGYDSVKGYNMITEIISSIQFQGKIFEFFYKYYYSKKHHWRPVNRTWYMSCDFPKRGIHRFCNWFDNLNNRVASIADKACDGKKCTRGWPNLGSSTGCRTHGVWPECHDGHVAVGGV